MKTTNKRRGFIRQLGGLGAGLVGAPIINTLSFTEATAKRVSTNLLSYDGASFWYAVREAYTSSPGLINFNNGGVSPQPKVVQDAESRYVSISNEGPAYFMWREIARGRETIRERLGLLAGCSADELALCRNATEALETVIFGIPLEKGDEIVTTNQDYPSMRNALMQREKRDGVKVNFISIPLAQDDKSVFVEAYRKAITPKTKAILVSHVINLTGQIMPVKEIADMAHAKGIEVIVDGAHSFAQFQFSIPDLGADYYGTSLHKWLCAPFGTGMLWVKKEKIEKLWPLFAPPHDADMKDIRKFEHLGTRSFPAELAIGQAIDFHNKIGSGRKENRLRYLKQYWVDKVIDLPGVRLNTSMNGDQSCGIANLTIDGRDDKKLQQHLFRDHRVYTVYIKHDEFTGVRVSPHIYSSIEDLDQFVNGVKSFVELKED